MVLKSSEARPAAGDRDLHASTEKKRVRPFSRTRDPNPQRAIINRESPMPPGRQPIHSLAAQLPRSPPRILVFVSTAGFTSREGLILWRRAVGLVRPGFRHSAAGSSRCLFKTATSHNGPSHAGTSERSRIVLQRGFSVKLRDGRNFRRESAE